MTKENKLPVLLLSLVLSFLGTACASPSPTQQPDQSPEPVNTSPVPSQTLEIPTPTSTGQTANASATNLPTVTPTPPPMYFKEDWMGDTSQWVPFSTIGNDNLWDVYNEAGVLVYSMTGKNITSYFIYRPWDYEQVKVTTQINNRTETKSTTVIVCDYSESLGWYEFDIGSDGLWQMRAHDTEGHTGYLDLQNGGSQAINFGPAVNEYSVSCIGNQLLLTINGTKAAEFTEDILKFSKGKIGLGVISYTQIPILIESNWIEISQP